MSKLKRLPLRPVEAPIPCDDVEWRALLALQAGNASDGQQRMALKWIVEKASGYYEISFRGGPDGALDTAFMEGRRFVGQQIVKQLNTSRAKKDVS